MEDKGLWTRSDSFVWKASRQFTSLLDVCVRVTRLIRGWIPFRSRLKLNTNVSHIDVESRCFAKRASIYHPYRASSYVMLVNVALSQLWWILTVSQVSSQPASQLVNQSASQPSWAMQAALPEHQSVNHSESYYTGQSASQSTSQPASQSAILRNALTSQSTSQQSITAISQ